MRVALAIVIIAGLLATACGDPALPPCPHGHVVHERCYKP